MGDFKVIPFEEKHIDMVIDFEKELRKQEPDTYFWEPDEEYKKAYEALFLILDLIQQYHLSL